jgi:NAD(P)-dependent dehydrogenase (short-subunit alcohol dehydrogenase family)
MSAVVAVAGGTGRLGRAIVESLVSSGQFKVFVLAREVCGVRELIHMDGPFTNLHVIGQ